MAKWQFALILFIASTCRLVMVESKVFERCELAKILHQRHRLDLTEVAQWVCIAQHSSGFNTAAQAGSVTSGSHGLFQISDVYWCSPPGQGAGCNLSCHKLRDDDLSDDLSCVKRIYNEHQRLSGDGYNAWNAYQQYCKQNAVSYIQDCFAGEQEDFAQYSSFRGYNSLNAIQDSSFKKNGKVYKRCELARELYGKHKMPMQQIPTWICIAEHESSLNTAAVGRLNADGSADHGLFQISDLYWCSHDRFGGGDGKACGLPCSKLLDSNITDDVHCIKRIFNEHTALSGDGFTAWTVYKPYCQNEGYAKIANCFQSITQQQHNEETYGLEMASNQIKFIAQLGFNSKNPFFKNIPDKNHYIPPSGNDNFKSHLTFKGVSSKGKIYTRCSLAQELYFKHHFPIHEISTWVCIAEHESQLNTAAVRSLNTDGSSDHGLFQINDRYWCDHIKQEAKACNLLCNKLLNDDISDDVVCIKTIYEEHNRLSGDGFNAWTVYKPHCQNQGIEHIKTCFDETTLSSFDTFEPSPSFNVEKAQENGKIYHKCELAEELYHRHNMPLEQIPKWVCIAEHESSFNTAAIGRLNTDGSADHGLFQISDLYWCSHDQYGGKACKLPCHKLLDSDISDDVECIKIIHEEHTRISGDGFNAWTVYQPHCRQTDMEHIKHCFTEQDLKKIASDNNTLISHSTADKKTTHKGKVYKKCELAKELYQKHQMPMEQIPKWVCIAQHESSLNTAAVGRLNTDGSADHGLFQISDLYWCSHDQFGGKTCNIPCDKLLDSDITDDVKCIKIIHEEHTRISGDGFNAWTVYKPHCLKTDLSHVKECFTEIELKQTQSNGNRNFVIPQSPVELKPKQIGKIYKKCELAQELYHKHLMPMEQIPKWVCIAQHESSFNTAAVGRLNTDGSADHGLFQISDLYWCSHDQFGGKACNIPCNKLLDSDITDDVKCIRIIHEEHTRISGDGFNAWTVYKPHCRNTGISHVKECFTIKEFNHDLEPKIPSSTNSLKPPSKPSTKSTSLDKVYEKCELAQELLTKHEMPMEQIPTWMCIAQHESALNTAAVGRLNTDGSLDHGLFQISDIYWCSHDKFGGKACNISCEKLLDSDITDDVQCIKIIYEEHTRISGDGFNAWTVYKPHCRNRKIEEIKSCLLPNQIEEFSTTQIPRKIHKNILRTQEETAKVSYNHNPFLSRLEPSAINEVASYDKNPFLQNIKIGSGSKLHETKANAPTKSGNKNQQNYLHNPFLNGYLKTSTFSQNLQQSGSFKPLPPAEKHRHFETLTETNYKNNPFLNGQFSSKTVNKSAKTPYEKSSEIDRFKNNPFLGHIELINSEKFIQSFPSNKSSLLTSSNKKSESNKNYINTNDFRSTTTTLKPKTTLSRPSASLTTPNNLSKEASDSTTTQKITTKYTDKLTASKTSGQTKKPTVSSTTKKPNTTITQKPTTAKTTISSSLTKNPTRKPQKTTISYNWQNQSNINTATTTRSPKTSTTRPDHKKNYPNLTTSKPSTKVNQKTISNQKYTSTKNSTQSVSNLNTIEGKTTTTKPQTITESWSKRDKNSTGNSNATQQKTSTTKPPKITTANWKKWDKTNSNDKATTKTPQTATESWTKWNESTTTKSKTKQKHSTTKAATTTETWRKWDKTITTKPNIVQPSTTENWKKDKTTIKKLSAIEQKLTTIKPQTTTVNWRKWDKTTTTKPNKAQQKSSTTRLPSTTENWKEGDKITTKKLSAIRQTSTTIKPQTTRENRSKWDKTTTTKPNIIQQKLSTTKLPSTTENWKKGDKTATKKLRANEQKSTTIKPQTTTENWRKWDKTTTKAQYSTEILRNWDRTSTKDPRTAAVSDENNKQKFTTTKLQNSKENSTKLDTTKIQKSNTTAYIESTTLNWKTNKESITTKPHAHTTTTRKPSTTTSNLRKTLSNLKLLQNSSSTKPPTSTENWQKWDRTTTKKPSTTTTNPANNRSHSRNLIDTTITQPLTTTENWRKWDRTTTKQPSLTISDLQKNYSNLKYSQNSSSTQPPTSTENWRKWDRTTTRKPSTPRSYSRNLIDTTTTKPLATTENWKKWDRTTNSSNKPIEVEISSSKTSTRDTTNAKSTISATTSEAKTTTQIPLENYKNSTTISPYKNESLKTTPQRPQNVEETSASDGFDKYKNDPFSHPFFAKINDKIKLLQKNFTTKTPMTTKNSATKRPEASK